MASSNIVSTLGAGSGIDIKSLAENLVEAERAPRKQRIDDKIAQTEAKISGYSAVKFALSELKTAFEKLNDANDFASLKVSNSQPSALGVTTTSQAAAGSLNLDVRQVAQAQRTASVVYATAKTPINGGAAFDLQLAVGSGAATRIAVTTATPEGVVSAVNGAKLGVTAQLINTGNGHQIVFTGETGSTKSFSLSAMAAATVMQANSQGVVVQADASATAVQLQYPDMNDATKTVTLALTKQADGNWTAPANSMPAGVVATAQATLPMPQTQPLQTAQDALFFVNGLQVTRSSNTVSDVLQGVTFELFTPSTGAARIDLNRDTTGIKDQIKALVTAYKDFDETLKVLGDRESKVETFGGALAGDSLLQNVRNQVRNLFTENSDTPGTTVVATRNVGLSFDRNGMLLLDEAKLDAALQNKFDEVVQMFSANTNNKSVYSNASAGVAGRAVKTLDEMLRSTGLIDKQSTTAQKKIADHKAELEKLQDRMDMLLNRYMKQFATMESIVGESNSLRTSLKGTFEGMMNAYK